MAGSAALHLQTPSRAPRRRVALSLPCVLLTLLAAVPAAKAADPRQPGPDPRRVSAAVKADASSSQPIKVSAHHGHEQRSSAELLRREHASVLDDTAGHSAGSPPTSVLVMDKLHQQQQLEQQQQQLENQQVKEAEGQRLRPTLKEEGPEELPEQGQHQDKPEQHQDAAAERQRLRRRLAEEHRQEQLLQQKLKQDKLKLQKANVRADFEENMAQKRQEKWSNWAKNHPKSLAHAHGKKHGGSQEPGGMVGGKHYGGPGEKELPPGLSAYEADQFKSNSEYFGPFELDYSSHTIDLNDWNLVVESKEERPGRGDLSVGTQNFYADATNSFIAGEHNTARGKDVVNVGGKDNVAEGLAVSVIGGEENVARGNMSVAEGGYRNEVQTSFGVVSGGTKNVVKGDYSAVTGGENNLAIGRASIVTGGRSNEAIGEYTAIHGGSGNKAKGRKSVIGGGLGQVTNGYAQSLFKKLTDEDRAIVEHPSHTDKGPGSR